MAKVSSGPQGRPDNLVCLSRRGLKILTLKPSGFIKPLFDHFISLPQQ